MTPVPLTNRSGARYPLVAVDDSSDISAIALALEAHGVTCDVIGDFLADWAADQSAATRWVRVSE